MRPQVHNKEAWIGFLFKIFPALWIWMSDLNWRDIEHMMPSSPLKSLIFNLWQTETITKKQQTLQCQCKTVFSIHPLTIHVWYIYLHLPYFTIQKPTSHVRKYTTLSHQINPIKPGRFLQLLSGALRLYSTSFAHCRREGFDTLTSRSWMSRWLEVLGSKVRISGKKQYTPFISRL